jgi:tetratricopeptide (TPR) repeat protein
MVRRNVFFAFLVSVIIIAGCAPKALIQIKSPGELNLEGVSKIAIVDFNTIKSSPSSGRFAVDQATIDLAKKSLTDVFYRTPFYSLVDLSLEKRLDPDGLVRRKTRFDAVLCGTVWWQTSGEYRNFKPDKSGLSKWKTVRYVCGRDKNGRAQYCHKDIITDQKDEFFKNYYRAVSATLMLALNVYRLNADGQDGRIEKVTEVFEIAKEHAFIQNGAFYLSKPVIFGDKGKKDRAETLKGENDLTATFTNFIDNLQGKGQKKISGDVEVTHRLTTIPSSLEFKIALMDTIQKKLQEKIAPHYEEFEVSIPLQSDQKTSALLRTSAFQAMIKYIISTRLAGGYRDFEHYFYDVDFQKGAEKVIKRKRRQEYAEACKGKSTGDIKPYEPISKKELQEKADDYLGDRTDDIYNLALAFEAIGEYDRALEIYRFAFERYEAADQAFADGIGRCMLALDMADQITEEMRTKMKATRRNRL